MGIDKDSTQLLTDVAHKNVANVSLQKKYKTVRFNVLTFVFHNCSFHVCIIWLYLRDFECFPLAKYDIGNNVSDF